MIKTYDSLIAFCCFAYKTNSAGWIVISCDFLVRSKYYIFLEMIFIKEYEFHTGQFFF